MDKNNNLSDSNREEFFENGQILEIEGNKRFLKIDPPQYAVMALWERKNKKKRDISALISFSSILSLIGILIFFYTESRSGDLFIIRMQGFIENPLSSFTHFALVIGLSAIFSILFVTLYLTKHYGQRLGYAYRKLQPLKPWNLVAIPPNDWKKCPGCHGTGKSYFHISRKQYHGNKLIQYDKTTGERDWTPDWEAPYRTEAYSSEGPCSKCSGKGYIYGYQRKTVELNKYISDYNSNIKEINNAISQINWYLNN